jgi:malonate transporter and related proteins
MGILHSFQSIAPIFLLILLGLILRRKGIPGEDFWRFNDRFAYWILFPALLYGKTSTIELSGDLIRPYAIVIYASFGVAALFGVITGLTLRYGGATTSSIMQGCARHNSFLALGLAERFFGTGGLSQAIIISALLIPITNIVSVTMIVILVQEQKKDQIFKAILRDLGRNPLLLGVLAGVFINQLNLAPIPIINDTANLLGAAALPMMLVGVGANIRIGEMSTQKGPVLAAIIGKLVVFPLMVVASTQLLGLSGPTAMILVLYGSVPTAASSYSLAHQMGGNAPLMAAIITIQTGLAFFTIPLTFALIQF